jgi:hypothetical protein
MRLFRWGGIGGPMHRLDLRVRTFSTASLNLLYSLLQGRLCGRPPTAAVLGRQVSRPFLGRQQSAR